jgi:prophage regulatory protein
MITAGQFDDRPVRILRLPQVRAMTGLGKTTIYGLEAARRFPRRIRIGCRAVGWVEGEVASWIKEQTETRLR